MWDGKRHRKNIKTFVCVCVWEGKQKQSINIHLLSTEETSMCAWAAAINRDVGFP